MSKNHSSPFPSCFRPTTTNHHTTVVSTPQVTGNPNLTTSLYHTQVGLFALTWSCNLFGRSFHLHLLLNNHSLFSLNSPSFELHIRPYMFWNKQGSKKLTPIVVIYWDLSRSRFGSGPEPESGYYIAVVIDGEISLLVGDSPKQAKLPEKQNPQVMVLRREHVYGNKLYTTKASFGGKTRAITIECRLGDESKLCFSVDNKRCLQIKHLKWKFRGNERIEVDGVHIQVSWDVHNWLFEDEEDGYALFMFRFEKNGDDEDYSTAWNHENNSYGFGFETRKMKKGLLRTPARSSSSAASSLSSGSSSCGSVIEWASVEENELKGPTGFSLLVYAWKS